MTPLIDIEMRWRGGCPQMQVLTYSPVGSGEFSGTCTVVMSCTYTQAQHICPMPVHPDGLQSTVLLYDADVLHSCPMIHPN